MITFEAKKGFYMKDNFIRVIFGLLTIGIILGITHIFNIDWQPFPFLLIALAGGWGGWYLYKAIKKVN
jgi:uncharacterized membrane protein